MEGASEAVPPVLGLVRSTTSLASAAGREDLVGPLTAAAARVRRPGTVLCVVGEFKQGKSSLVNALLERDVCPVDDDLATSAVTIVHHADTPTAVVRRQGEPDEEGNPGPVEVAEVDPTRVRELVTEAGLADGDGRRVERVDIGVPDDLLASGLTLVDTPGAGGLAAGHAAATLGFLPFADGLLFVTDASQELTRPEVTLLREATARCPLVVCVLTKVDLHPHWRRIAELDRGHLAREGLDVPVVPVSSVLRGGDRPESGIDELLMLVQRDVVDRAKAVAGARAAEATAEAVRQLRHAADGELQVLLDPDRAAELEATVERARERLAHLRGPAASWRSLLSDRTSDLQGSTTRELRRLTREVDRGIDAELEGLRSSEDWDRLARELQNRVAEAIATLFAGIREAGDEVRVELSALLGDDEVHLPTGDDDARPGELPDLAELWSEPAPEEGRARAADGLSALRGVQSGVVMFGMMGRMLPAAAATLVASNPIMLGAGLLLGGKAVRDQRERRVAQQRQEARKAVRRFLDDVQFELGPQLQQEVTALQRQCRDAVTARLAELQEMWTRTGRQAQEALAASAAQRTEREATLRAHLAALDEVSAGLDAIRGPAS